MRTAARVVMTALFGVALAMTACSSDSEGDLAGDSTDGGGAPGAASDGSAPGDGKAYELNQTFDMSIEVTSPVFNRIRRIPKTHVCKGSPPKPGEAHEQDALTKYADRENVSPPLEWTGIPDGTQSIALLMDSDQLPGDRWVHWLIWNLSSDTAGLPERVATTTEVSALGTNTRQGINDDQIIGYSGPCPGVVTDTQLWGSENKRLKLVFEYLFTVFALDIVLDLPGGATADEFLQAIDGHILSGGTIRGEFVASKQLN